MTSDATSHNWSVAFDERFKKHLMANNYRALADYAKPGARGPLAVPSLDHYLPVLYTLGLAEQERVQLLPV